MADELSSDQVTYYRQVLKTHANDPETGECNVCHKRTCPDWVDAFDKLASANGTMAEPEDWLKNLPGIWR